MLPISMLNLNSNLPKRQQLCIKSPLGLSSSPKIDSVPFGNNMSELKNFVINYSQKIPAENVTANDVNLTLLGVKKLGEPSAEVFSKLAQPIKDLIKKADNEELSYLHLGAEMGDQGIALQTMGLGHLLGEWKILSPDTLVPSLPKEQKKMLVGQGLLKIVDNSWSLK